MSKSNVSKLLQVTSCLERHKIDYSIGGSGLLYFLKIIDSTGDWDIFTDEPLSTIEKSISELDYKVFGPNDMFKSNYLIKVNVDGFKVEIIGGFAIKKDEIIHQISSDVESYYENIPLASIDEWIKAYDLMNRPEKRDLLINHKNSRSIL